MCGVINVGDAKIFVLTVIFSCGCVQAVIKRSRNAAQLTLFPRWSRSIWMTAWEQRKLGELGLAQSGIGFPDAEQGGTEGTPFFKVSDMNTPGNEYELVASNNYVTAEQIARMGWRPINQVPAIFFAKVGAAVMLNRKRLINEPFLLDNNTMAFSMDSSLLDTQFGQSLFERLDLTSLIQVGALPSFNSSDVESIFVSLPSTMNEQCQIGQYLCDLNTLITLHQRKCQYRSLYGYLSWEQRKLGELYSLVSEKNDLTFGRESIISVANMYFNANVNVTDEQYLRTYNVMRLGDIAFEGHSNKEFSHGRFVENYIGDGIVSHIFTVLRPRVPFDVNYWRYAINNEKLMRLSLIRSTKASTMMHDLVPSDFLREAIPTPTLAEQKEIGAFLVGLDHLITLHQ